MKKSKKEEGITLIALVVTVIVLLILAGVTIAALSGDNEILNNAARAKEETDTATDIEKIKLAMSEAQIGENGYQELDVTNFKKLLESYFEGRNIQLSDNGDESYMINLDNGSKKYYVDSNGKIISNANIVSIGTVDELKAFRDDVNSGNSYEGKYVYLTDNITLDINEEWEPIGIYLNDATTPDDERNISFKGIFNGCGYEINGIYINTTEKVKGLFSFVTGGKILNLGIGENCNIQGGVGTAGILGYAYKGTSIYNCYNKSNIIGNAASASGIVAIADTNVVINNSYNTGDIEGNSNIGGIVGFATGNVHIEKNFNVGNISSKSSNAGGVIGVTYNTVEIEYCYNVGNIESENGNGVGGITGGSSTDSSISYCYNIGKITGNISASRLSGGIVGNLLERAATKMNFYLENIVNNGNDVEIIDGIEAKTSEDLKNAILSFSDVFQEDKNNINNGYPIFNWQ